MNIDAARRLAAEAAQATVSSTLPCLAVRSGLIVLVVRDDGEMMGGVDLQVSGFEVATTDDNGMCTFSDIVPGQRDVQISRIPDPDVIYAAMGSVRRRVEPGECPVCVLTVGVFSRPTVALTWKHAPDQGVQGVAISVGANRLPGVTGVTGVLSWPTTEAPLPLGAADVTFVFPDGRYKIFGADDNEVVGTPSVQLTAGRRRYTFTAVKLVALKIGVTRPVAGAADAWVTGANVAIKWPIGAALTTVASADTGAGVRAAFADVPAILGDASTCPVESLVMPDVDGDAPAFEFVSLTTA